MYMLEPLCALPPLKKSDRRDDSTYSVAVRIYVYCEAVDSFRRPLWHRGSSYDRTMIVI